MEEKSKERQVKEIDGIYFESYAHLGIHEEMIKDQVRTETYRRAIFSHASFFKDKVVLDVGCGTGILSFFCAQAGARKVYAVDASQIADEAAILVAHNSFQDKIQVIKGKMEEVELPEKVDVIVSEWMGYGLLYECMLSSVLFARDKYLKEGGWLYPSQAQMFAVPFTDPELFEQKKSFFDRKIYDIDFSPLVKKNIQGTFVEPVIDIIPNPSSLLSFPMQLKVIDLMTITEEELKKFSCSFFSSIIIDGDVHGLCLWFDVLFEIPRKDKRRIPSSPPQKRRKTEQEEEPKSAFSLSSLKKIDEAQANIRLTTSPDSKATHWQQTLLYFNEPFSVKQDDNISGTFLHMVSNKGHRFVDYKVEIHANNELKVTKGYQLK